MADISGSFRRGNYSAKITEFSHAAIRSTFDGRAVSGWLKGWNVGEATSMYGDTINGRNLIVGVTQSMDEGNPTSPCLKLEIPNFWRFRWIVKTGTRNISVSAKQNSTGSYRPSVVIKSNSSIGLDNDISGSAPDGAGWQTIGPISFVSTGNGVVWVELHHNNTIEFDTPAFFDHIVTT